MPPPVLAHVGHWYHALLYLAPVLVLAVFFTIQGRRERRREGPREPPEDSEPDDT
jgi:hypothetical protein